MGEDGPCSNFVGDIFVSAGLNFFVLVDSCFGDEEGRFIKFGLLPLSSITLWETLAALRAYHPIALCILYAAQ